jgi:FkbM family methyltransferase
MHDVINFFAPGDIYFDVGAHKGDKADYFLQKGYECVLVEPQPNLVEHLRQKYQDQPLAHIVPKGLGKEIDILEMSISSTEPVLSTFSEDWKLGRFINTVWDQKKDIQITTLDILIKKYGNPRYLKIDVEGHELEVLRGLSSKVGILSIEFTAEYISNTFKCISYLDALGYTKFNISLGESSSFALDHFIGKEKIIAILSDNAKQHPLLWGDVYAN